MSDFEWETVPLNLSRNLDERAVLRRFPPHQDLFLQGEQSQEIFTLVSGRAKLWRVNDQGVATTLLLLGSGEVLGTLGMVHGTANPVTATAIDTVTARVWPARLFREAMTHDAELASSLLRVVARRAAQLVDRFEDIVGLSVEERLARLLLRLTSEVVPHGDRLVLVLELRQQELADMCFSTVPTVSRTLAGWEKSGIVESERGRIRILHLSRLAGIAGIHID